MKTTLSNRTVGMIIAAFLFAALPHLAAMPLPLALVIVAAAGWRAAAARWHLRAPHWAVRALLTFGGLALVVMHFGTLWGRRAATVMLCVMLAAKLTEMFRLRDARMVAALGYFLIATQFLFSQRLILFAYLLAGCWLATAALVQIQRDADGPGAEKHAPAHAWAGLKSGLKSGLALLVLAVPFALVMFALFPRLTSPLWGMPDEALDGRTGLSDEMSPGTIANLFADDSPAFRAEFDDPAPPRNELYWRGPVLWRFDGRTWRRLFYSNRPPERLPRRDGSAFSYRVQLEPNERRWLFSLDYPVRWPDDARLTADFELIRRRPVTSLLEYGVVSQPRFDDRPALPHTLRQLALALPEGSNPRTREHARQLRRQYPDDRALIAAVLEWFNTDPFVYSLETMPLGRHGADEFLFDLRRGYCEYYASAFAILMRAAGIPARIVTGYQGGHWQGSGQGSNQDGYLLVRHSDAHAWTEVWLDGNGWVRVDPTAAVSPDRIEEGARAALPNRGWFDAEWLYTLRNRYDRLQHLWNQWVLGFDAARQHSLLNGMGLGALPDGVKAALLIVLAGLVLVPLALLLHAVVRGTARPGATERAWLRIRKRLARAGIRPDEAETPLELARRAAPRLANGDELVALAAQYCLCRYGPSDRNRLVELERRSRRWVPRLVNSRGTATV